MRAFLSIFVLSTLLFFLNICSAQANSGSIPGIHQWLSQAEVQQNLAKARRAILDGKGLEQSLEILNLPISSEIYQALFQEPLNGAVARFMEAASEGSLKEAVQLYDTILVPAYHYRFFLHVVLQGTPLKEAISHFKLLDPFLKQALLDESDRDQISHYARVRMGLRKDPSAFFRLKGIHYGFARAYKMVDEGKPLEEALAPLLHPRNSFRFQVLSNEKYRDRVQDYLKSARDADPESEREKWATLLLLWASQQAVEGRDLRSLQEAVGIFPGEYGVGLLLRKGEASRVSFLYKALALRRFHIAPQFFDMDLPMKWSIQAVEMLHRGVGAEEVLKKLFGLDARFPIYRVLAEDAYREELIGFYRDLSNGKGFYASFEKLAMISSYEVPGLLQEGETRSPQELARFRQIYKKDLVMEIIAEKEGPQIPGSGRVLIPTDPSNENPFLQRENGPILSRAGRFLDLLASGKSKGPEKEIKIAKKPLSKQKREPETKKGISLGPVGPFPLPPEAQKKTKRRGYQRLLTKLKNSLRKLR